MTPTLRRAWTAALRSGRYPQTHGNLRNKVGYCCLGVLCDVVYPDGWRGFLHDLKSQNGASLSPTALKEVGMSDEVQTKLYCMNDGLGALTSEHSFSEIADWIDTHDIMSGAKLVVEETTNSDPLPPPLALP